MVGIFKRILLFPFLNALLVVSVYNPATVPLSRIAFLFNKQTMINRLWFWKTFQSSQTKILVSEKRIIRIWVTFVFNNQTIYVGDFGFEKDNTHFLLTNKPIDKWFKHTFRIILLIVDFKKYWNFTIFYFGKYFRIIVLQRPEIQTSSSQHNLTVIKVSFFPA